MNGTIKTLVKEKRFGFIAREGQIKDLFFHANEMKDGVEAYDTLNVGDAVTFEVKDTEKGPSATGVARA